MSLKIRLRQQGKKNRYVYRLVLTESRSPRDGKYIEMLGWYNPFETELEKMVAISGERVLHWLNHGAIISERAIALLEKTAPQVLQNYKQKLLAKQEKVRQKRRTAKKKKAAA